MSPYGAPRDTKRWPVEVSHHGVHKPPGTVHRRIFPKLCGQGSYRLTPLWSRHETKDGKIGRFLEWKGAQPSLQRYHVFGLLDDR